jgi:hypothetical protein
MKSYDWIPSQKRGYFSFRNDAYLDRPKRPAKKVIDKEVEGPATSVLFPEYGNLHSFHAETSAGKSKSQNFLKL